MKTIVFLDKARELGYDCHVSHDRITVYKLYGPKLRSKQKVAVIMMGAPYQYDIRMDPSDVTAGIADLVCEFGQSTIRQRGQLYAYDFRDGNAIRY